MNIKSITSAILMTIATFVAGAQIKLVETSFEANYLMINSKSQSLTSEGLGNPVTELRESYQVEASYFINQDFIFMFNEKFGLGIGGGVQYLEFQRNSWENSTATFQENIQTLSESMTEQIDVGYALIGANMIYQLNHKWRITLGLSSSALLASKNERVISRTLSSTDLTLSVSDFRVYPSNQSDRGFNTSITWINTKINYKVVGGLSIYLSGRTGLNSILIEEYQIGGNAKYNVVGVGVSYNWIKP